MGLPTFMHRRRALIIWIVFAGTACLLACQKEPIPSDLVGVWGSQDGRYSGCYLRITDKTLVFGRADLSAASFAIQKVAVKNDHKVLICAITAVDQKGDPITVELHYVPQDRDEMWFKNQPGVRWRRFNGVHYRAF